ncbi:hypothetical protein PY365_21640 [Roseiarcaceae bacterium H3SJ34-1]|nr:hypothetical protein [Roseiarcaceae bacterium H3SJ34-1]
MVQLVGQAIKHVAEVIDALLLLALDEAEDGSGQVPQGGREPVDRGRL